MTKCRSNFCESVNKPNKYIFTSRHSFLSGPTVCAVALNEKVPGSILGNIDFEKLAWCSVSNSTTISKAFYKVDRIDRVACTPVFTGRVNMEKLTLTNY